jgi:uncharacterized protein YjbI with pentapeptide repeats
MLKKINASAWGDRLQSLRPSKQMLLAGLRQSLIVPIVLVGVYVVFPLLQDGVPLSPQQRVEPLEQRINDLDKQIKASKTPSTADLKEIATLEKGRIDSENTIRTSLFQAVGGLLVFVTLYISWRTLQANEAKQVAERFSKAVEQLGNDNIHVRLGGIYALEQIAKDAEEKYYWQVMETLTSYVRKLFILETKEIEEEFSPLRIDIQTTMIVLVRRNHTYGQKLEPYRLNLSGADLRCLELPPKAKLQGALLRRARLQGANLMGAHLCGADLRGANLTGAHLCGADLRRANLELAILQWSELQGADLQKANLEGAELQNAKLGQAILKGANLKKATLQEANLERATLQNANLDRAKLQESDFEESKLQGAILTGANLENANFKGANLKKAEGLTRHQLDKAASYEGAILPSNMPPRSQQATESVQANGVMAAAPEEMLNTALKAIRLLAISYKNV